MTAHPLLSPGIRPLTPAPAPERPAEPLRLAWEVRPERIETTTADGRIETRLHYAVRVEGQLFGWRADEADATEQARDLAGVL